MRLKEMTTSQQRRRRRHIFDDSIRQELGRLSRGIDNWHGPLALATDVALIGGAITLAVASPWAYPVSLFLIGTRQRALATLLHEGSHQTLCGCRSLGRGIGTVAGWAVFQSFHRYRESHGKGHHPNLGDEALDPDVINYARQRLFDADPRSFVVRHLLPLALGLKTPSNVMNLVRDRLLPRRGVGLKREERAEYALFVAFWLGLVTACGWAGVLGCFLLFWVVPYLTVFQGVNWLIELAEHFPLTRLFDREIEMTRNRRGGIIENLAFGIHGENWHLVHHVQPGLPFWRLAQAHEVMMRDPAYAEANSRSGGLLVKGPGGEPSIISLLGQELSRSQGDEVVSA